MSAHTGDNVFVDHVQSKRKENEFNLNAQDCNKNSLIDLNVQNKVINREMNNFIEICEDMIRVAVHNKMGFIDFEMNEKEKKLFPNVQHYIKDVIAKGKEKEFTMKWIEGKNNTSYSNSSFLTTPSILHVSWE